MFSTFVLHISPTTVQLYVDLCTIKLGEHHLNSIHSTYLALSAAHTPLYSHLNQEASAGRKDPCSLTLPFTT